MGFGPGSDTYGNVPSFDAEAALLSALQFSERLVRSAAKAAAWV